ncbi:Crp/Fnr family transcriptional regulator [Plebeiibacterium marinum]|uniref:Crp/Fnr family transcriptional regulator n=1 Tax=Plebeiibacterium marinum TaxID=2992111 RepID=A0AAE3MD46_9BACT|nr:Crp/Fnr family transcriptional regulator [Plebeiobacterium marinum]MCW3805377.1 Crp/Fnr family transcriptional regulator [Plebeiobacterium marinum]
MLSQVERKSYENFIVNPVLSDISLFNLLTDEEKMLLERNSSRYRFKRGTIIYYEGKRHSGIYCVLKGVVKIFKMGCLGKEQILRFAHKGDVIAYRSLLTNEIACTSAKVTEDAEVCNIPYAVLMELFERNWKFRQYMMRMMCKELNEVNCLVTEIAQKSVRERTAEILLYFKDEFGIDFDNTLKIRITRVELANNIGTATESVIRVLKAFENENLIELDGRQIKILNSGRLREIADFQMYRQHCKF